MKHNALEISSIDKYFDWRSIPSPTSWMCNNLESESLPQSKNNIVQVKSKARENECTTVSSESNSSSGSIEDIKLLPLSNTAIGSNSKNTDSRIIAPYVDRLSLGSTVEVIIVSSIEAIAVLCSVDVLKMRSTYFLNLLQIQEDSSDVHTSENIWRHAITVECSSPFEAAAFLESIHDSRANFSGKWNLTWARLSVLWCIEEMEVEFKDQIQSGIKSILAKIKQNHWRTNSQSFLGYRVSVLSRAHLSHPSSGPTPTLSLGQVIESATRINYSRLKIVYDTEDVAPAATTTSNDLCTNTFPFSPQAQVKHMLHADPPPNGTGPSSTLHVHVPPHPKAHVSFSENVPLHQGHGHTSLRPPPSSIYGKQMSALASPSHTAIARNDHIISQPAPGARTATPCVVTSSGTVNSDKRSNRVTGLQSRRRFDNDSPTDGRISIISRQKSFDDLVADAKEERSVLAAGQLNDRKRDCSVHLDHVLSPHEPDRDVREKHIFGKNASFKDITRSDANGLQLGDVLYSSMCSSPATPCRPPKTGEIAEPFWVQVPEDDSRLKALGEGSWVAPDDVSYSKLQSIIGDEEKIIFWEMVAAIMEFPQFTIQEDVDDIYDRDMQSYGRTKSTHCLDKEWSNLPIEIVSPNSLAEVMSRKENKILWLSCIPVTLPHEACAELVRSAYVDL